MDRSPASLLSLQARLLEWVAVPPPGDLPDPEIKPTPLTSLHWQVGSLPLAAPGKPTMAPKPAADALLGVGDSKRNTLLTNPGCQSLTTASKLGCEMKSAEAGAKHTAAHISSTESGVGSRIPYF